MGGVCILLGVLAAQIGLVTLVQRTASESSQGTQAGVFWLLWLPATIAGGYLGYYIYLLLT